MYVLIVFLLFVVFLFCFCIPLFVNVTIIIAAKVLILYIIIEGYLLYKNSIETGWLASYTLHIIYSFLHGKQSTYK